MSRLNREKPSRRESYRILAWARDRRPRAQELLESARRYRHLRFVRFVRGSLQMDPAAEVLKRSPKMRSVWRPAGRSEPFSPTRPARDESTAYGLSTQNRKNSGRVSRSLGFDMQRARGEVPERGNCCGGGVEAQPARRTASSTRARSARVTGRYHNPAYATRLRSSLSARRRRAAASRHEGADPAWLRRADGAPDRDLRAERSASRSHPAGRHSARGFWL